MKKGLFLTFQFVEKENKPSYNQYREIMPSYLKKGTKLTKYYDPMEALGNITI